jgi:hypothetical protein
VFVVAIGGGASVGCSGSQSGSASISGADGSSEMTDDASSPGTSSSTNDAAAAHASDAGGSDASASSTGGEAPAGQSGANAYCAAVCDREATCYNVALDASMCHCDAGTLTLYRSDYVTRLGACESAATCADLLADGSVADSGLETCADSALAQITPTAAVTSLCSKLGLSTCPEDVVPDCPGTFKVYSDGTVNAVSACIADPNCNDHAACVTTALTP